MRPILLSWVLGLAVLCLSFTAGSTFASAIGQDGSRTAKVTKDIVLNPRSIAAGGIKTAPLQAIRRARTVTAFGEVLDPARLSVLSAQFAEMRAEIAAGRAKVALAQSIEKRAADLFHAERNISKARYQAAQAAAQVATADLAVAEARLRALSASIRADWGATLAKAIETDSTPRMQLESGAACLVQVTLSFGQVLTAAPSQAAARTPVGAALTLKLVSASPRTPAGGGPAFFYLGIGPTCPPIGMPLRIRLPSGSEQEGVMVPASAVVWKGSTPIAYRQQAEGRFVPVSVAAAAPVTGGYFVPGGAGAALRNGESVVVQGAALLLSKSETPTRSKGGDGDD